MGLIVKDWYDVLVTRTLRCTPKRPPDNAFKGKLSIIYKI